MLSDSLEPATQDLAACLACDLSALTPAEHEQQEAAFNQLRTMVEAVEELPTGWALRLPASGETLRAVADFIRYERLCCPFFDFNLHVLPDAGPIWLQLTGRPGVKDFLSRAFSPGAARD
jgi:hypothetical protein